MGGDLQACELRERPTNSVALAIKFVGHQTDWLRNRASSSGVYPCMRITIVLVLLLSGLAVQTEFASAQSTESRMERREARTGGDDGAPARGSTAPKVSAVTPDGAAIDLSNPDRITVLVFGSHT